MWQIILIIGISYAGICVDANALMLCNPQKCEQVGPQIQPGSLDDVFPTEERLNEMCPSILALVECSEVTMEECLGATLLESAESDNETIAAVANIYVGISDLFRDLCDKDSDLHARYAANFVCIKSIVTNPLSMSLCALEANSLYGAFKYASGEEAQNKEESCMVAAHIIACTSADVVEECGEEARSTLIEIMKRTRMMKYVCSLEDFVNLKAKYIEFLELESSKKSIFEKAFDFRKRR